jgi:hypothetical protein
MENMGKQHKETKLLSTPALLFKKTIKDTHGQGRENNTRDRGSRLVSSPTLPKERRDNFHGESHWIWV